MRGTIQGTEIYLDENELPAFSFSINSIVDPSKVKGSHSTTIRVVSTKESRRVLGTEHMADVGRVERPVLVIGDEIADLYRANVVVKQHARDTMECVGVGGNASWFEYAKDVELKEFDFGESAPLTKAYVKGTWTDEDDLVYFPLVDYGYLQDRADTFNVQRWRLRPALRVHRILDLAFAPSGYRIRARGRLADVWKKFVVLQPADALTPHFYGNPQGATARPSGTSSYTLTDLGSSGNTYPLGLEVFDPASNFASNAFTAPSTGTMDVRIDGAGIEVDPFAEPASGEMFYLHVWDDTAGAPVATYAKAYVTGEFQVRWYYTFRDVPVTSGNDYTIVVQRETGGYSGSTSISPFCLVTFSPTDPFFTPSYFKWDEEDIVAYTLDSVQMPISLASSAPDISLADLVTAMVNNQGLVVVTNTDTKLVEFWYETEYLRKPVRFVETRDWTQRIDHTVAPIKVRPDSPTRIKFRWEDDAGDNELYRAGVLTAYPKYANEDYAMPNATGKEQTIDLPFAPSVMGPMFGGNLTVPILRAKDGDYQADDYDRSLRLLVADGLATGDWTYSLSSETDYPNCYFVTGAANGVPIHWGNATAGYAGTVEQRWADRLLRMKTGLILEAFLFIRDHELQDFDHGMPTLVDDGSGPAWYYVQEIVEHRFGSGRPTKCRLVQIPGKEAALEPIVNPAISYPEPVFVCAGPGYVAFTVGSGGEVTISVDGSHFAVRSGAGTVTPTATGEAYATGAGSFCLWASDSAGEKTGGILNIFIVDASALDVQYLPELVSLVIDSASTITSLDLTNNPVMEVVGYQSTSLTTVALVANSVWHTIALNDSSLTQSAVNHVILVAYASAVLGATFPGGIDLSGGTSPAPDGTVATELAILTGTGGMEVTASGSDDANGEYTLTGTANGRDRYVHNVNGISEVIWNGTNWIVFSIDGIYTGTEDVAQPWLVTTWTATSAPGPVPVLTPPGFGITVTTN